MSVEPPARERRRIPLRAPITGLVLVLLVVLGGFYGWRSAFGPGNDTGAAADGCPTTSATVSTSTTSGPPPTVASVAPAGAVTTIPTTTPPAAGFLQPGDVEVNVLNATETRGLANNTAALLRERGFVISFVGNDKLQAVIPGAAQIRAAVTDMPEVRLLAQHVPGAEVIADGRTDSSVDLVIGEAFQSLGDPATVTPVPIATPRC